MIELKKVHHVIEIARQGGFAKAAASLNITQSALTRSVQSLEERMGLQVFERGPRGIRLTPDGERFVERAARVMAEAADLEDFARGARTLAKGRIRIGAAPASFRVLWMDALPSFAGRFPGIQIETVAESVDEIARLLAAGELDFAVGSLEGLKAQAELQVEDLANVPVEPCVRRGHVLDSDEPPSLEALFAHPMVGPSSAEPHRMLIQRLALENNSPFAVPHLVVDSFSLALRIVQRTDAFSFVFAPFARSPGFADTFRSWPDWQPLPPLPLSIASRLGWRPTLAAKPLLDLIRESAKRLTL